jgi:uncharacterized Zn-binding protein involved in type VI secretion
VPVTVNINGLSAIHQLSNGIATATAPDVCLTPGPGGPVPVPYPNIAMSSDLVQGTTSITLDGAPAAIFGSKFVKSTGDEPGSLGGVLSAVFIMEASFISFSPTVLLDGKPACRLSDKMLMNKTNTFCMNGVLNPGVPPAAPPPDADQNFTPDEPKHCTMLDVFVKCGHAERGLVPISMWSGKDDVTLEVISKAHEPDTLIAEWQGTCEFGHA